MNSNIIQMNPHQSKRPVYLQQAAKNAGIVSGNFNTITGNNFGSGQNTGQFGNGTIANSSHVTSQGINSLNSKAQNTIQIQNTNLNQSNFNTIGANYSQPLSDYSQNEFENRLQYAIQQKKQIGGFNPPRPQQNARQSSQKSRTNRPQPSNNIMVRQKSGGQKQNQKEPRYLSNNAREGALQMNLQQQRPSLNKNNQKKNVSQRAQVNNNDLQAVDFYNHQQQLPQQQFYNTSQEGNGLRQDSRDTERLLDELSGYPPEQQKILLQLQMRQQQLKQLQTNDSIGSIERPSQVPNQPYPPAIQQQMNNNRFSDMPRQIPQQNLNQHVNNLMDQQQQPVNNQQKRQMLEQYYMQKFMNEQQQQQKQKQKQQHDQQMFVQNQAQNLQNPAINENEYQKFMDFYQKMQQPQIPAQQPIAFTPELGISPGAQSVNSLNNVPVGQNGTFGKPPQNHSSPDMRENQLNQQNFIKSPSSDESDKNLKKMIQDLKSQVEECKGWLVETRKSGPFNQAAQPSNRTNKSQKYNSQNRDSLHKQKSGGKNNVDLCNKCGQKHRNSRLCSVKSEEGNFPRNSRPSGPDLSKERLSSKSSKAAASGSKISPQIGGFKSRQRMPNQIFHDRERSSDPILNSRVNPKIEKPLTGEENNQQTPTRNENLVTVQEEYQKVIRNTADQVPRHTGQKDLMAISAQLDAKFEELGPPNRDIRQFEKADSDSQQSEEENEEGARMVGENGEQKIFQFSPLSSKKQLNDEESESEQDSERRINSQIIENEEINSSNTGPYGIQIASSQQQSYSMVGSDLQTDQRNRSNQNSGQQSMFPMSDNNTLSRPNVEEPNSYSQPSYPSYRRPNNSQSQINVLAAQQRSIQQNEQNKLSPGGQIITTPFLNMTPNSNNETANRINEVQNVGDFIAGYDEQSSIIHNQQMRTQKVVHKEDQFVQTEECGKEMAIQTEKQVDQQQLSPFQTYDLLFIRDLVNNLNYDNEVLHDNTADLKTAFVFLQREHKQLQFKYEKEKRNEKLVLLYRERLREVEKDRDSAIAQGMKLKTKFEYMTEFMKVAVEENTLQQQENVEMIDQLLGENKHLRMLMNIHRENQNEEVIEEGVQEMRDNSIEDIIDQQLMTYEQEVQKTQDDYFLQIREEQNLQFSKEIDEHKQGLQDIFEKDLQERTEEIEQERTQTLTKELTESLTVTLTQELTAQIEEDVQDQIKESMREELQKEIESKLRSQIEQEIREKFEQEYDNKKKMDQLKLVNQKSSEDDVDKTSTNLEALMQFQSVEETKDSNNKFFRVLDGSDEEDKQDDIISSSLNSSEQSPMRHQNNQMSNALNPQNEERKNILSNTDPKNNEERKSLDQETTQKLLRKKEQISMNNTLPPKKDVRRSQQNVAGGLAMIPSQSQSDDWSDEQPPGVYDYDQLFQNQDLTKEEEELFNQLKAREAQTAVGQEVQLQMTPGDLDKTQKYNQRYQNVDRDFLNESDETELTLDQLQGTPQSDPANQLIFNPQGVSPRENQENRPTTLADEDELEGFDPPQMEGNQDQIIQNGQAQIQGFQGQASQGLSRGGQRPQDFPSQQSQNLGVQGFQGQELFRNRQNANPSEDEAPKEELKQSSTENETYENFFSGLQQIEQNEGLGSPIRASEETDLFGDQLEDEIRGQSPGSPSSFEALINQGEDEDDAQELIAEDGILDSTKGMRSMLVAQKEALGIASTPISETFDPNTREENKEEEYDYFLDAHKDENKFDNQGYHIIDPADLEVSDNSQENRANNLVQDDEDLQMIEDDDLRQYAYNNMLEDLRESIQEEEQKGK